MHFLSSYGVFVLPQIPQLSSDSLLVFFFFLNQDGLEHRKSYLLQAVSQTMLTCIVINTPNLAGYTWVECSIRDGPGQTIRDLKTDHTYTAHCQKYLWLPKVEGPNYIWNKPTFQTGLLQIFYSAFFLSMFIYHLTTEDGTNKSPRNAGK